jgi:uncharacterized protein YkwD
VYVPRLLIVCAAALAFALVPAGTASAACAKADADPGHASPREVRRAVLCLLNEQRAAHGVRALAPNRKLNRSAARYAREMARHRFFSHVGTVGEAPAARVAAAGYMKGRRGRWTIGENLAWGIQGVDETPRAIVARWMASPSHRTVLLMGVFKSLGVGVALPTPHGGQGATYVTHFGS